MLRFQHGFPGKLTKKQPLPNAGRTSPFVSRPNQCIQRKTERDRSRRVAGEIISLPVFFRSWKRRTQSADLRSKRQYLKADMSQSRSFIGTGKHEFQPSQSRIGANAPKMAPNGLPSFNSPPQLAKSLPRAGRSPVENPIFSHAGALRGK